MHTSVVDFLRHILFFFIIFIEFKSFKPYFFSGALDNCLVFFLDALDLIIDTSTFNNRALDLIFDT